MIIHKCELNLLLKKFFIKKKYFNGGRENLTKLNNKLILIILFFALAITFCGTSAAVTIHTNQTLNTTTPTNAANTTTNQTLNTTATSQPATNTTTTTSTSKPTTTTTTTTSTTSKPNTANIKPSTTTNTTTTTSAVTSNPTTITTVTSNATVITTKAVTTITNTTTTVINTITTVTTTKTITTTTKTVTTITKTITTTTTITTAASHAGDPIISGNVNITDYNTRSLANAIITINSTGSNSRVLATTTTDQNGNYNISFYSTATSFIVTASYMGTTPVSKTITVATGPNYPKDPNYYGTANFTLTPLTATWNGAYGYYDGNVYIRYYDGYYAAGEVTMAINGTNYQSYCIDLYTEINPGGTLWVNGPLPGTSGRLNSQVNWGDVNYIINNYIPTSNDMAAAIQCAIWYFASAPYGAYPGNNTNYPGYYQFMTFNGDSTHPADGILNGGSTAVRTEAWQIINATLAAPSFQYPYGITLSPNTNVVANGGTQILTATVTDTNGNPLSGITVNFTTDSGKLTSSTGTTNSNGQVTTTLSSVPNGSTADVTASVSGNYGASLYDSPSKPQQNLVTMSLLPFSLSATSNINFNVTANVALTQTVNTPLKIGNTVTYTVTATNQGPSTATGIMITDFAPTGLTSVIYTNSTGTTYYNGVWTIPSLSSGNSATLIITGTATSGMAGLNTTNNATRTNQNENDNLNATSLASVYTLIPTQLNVNNVTGIIGSQVNLTATLTDNNNNPVIGATVNFYVNNGTTPVGSGTTNSNGIAAYTYTIPMTLTRGTYPINATYNGNATYQNSNGTGNLTVNLIPTQLIVNNVTGTPGSSVNLIGTLTANSNPVSGATVNFYVNGSSVGSAPTNSSGVATFAYTIPTTLTSGTYTINATYAGNGTYQLSNGTGNLTVNLIPTSLVVSNVTGTPGSSVNLIGTLTANSNPVSGATINFYVNGSSVGSAPTNSSGVATFAYTIPTTLTSGTYTINATYAGNGTYQLSNGTGNLTVNLIPTSLVVSNVTGTPGSSVNLIGTLTANSNPVSGATINFYVNGSSVGSAPTNSSGVATFAYTIPTTLTSGTYTINATYAGNGTYQLSNGTGNLTVNLIPTSLVVSNVTGTPGSSVNLIGTLTANSNPVSGATINFYVNGSSVGSAPTNSSGVATFAYTIPTTLTSGTYTINATYAGNGTYQLSNGTGNLTVNLIPTSLVVSNVTGTPGSSVNLIGTLTANSNPVSGATINFYVNGSSVGSAPTNSSGVATFAYTIPTTLTSGTYTINATYAGNGTYQLSNGTGNLTVNLIPTSLVVSNVTGTPGSSVNLIGTLTANSNPVSGATINFYVNGSSVGSAPTNSSGVATFAYTIPTTLTSGTYTINATYAGNGTYQLSNGTGNLTVNLIPTSLVVSNVTGTPGSSVNLIGTLTANSNPVSGATINFYVNGSSVGSAPTNSSGVATFAYTIPTTLTSGTYTINATYAGNGTYQLSNGTGNLTVNLIPTSLVVSNVTGTPGSSVNLIGTLTANSNPVSGATINFYVNGSSVGSAPTNSSGVATFAYTIPTTLTSGTYTINATYAGNGTYQLSNGTGNLTVNLIPTSLVVSNVTGTPGSSVNLIGTLTANSNPVSGATINFYVNGSSVGSAPTNSSGVATFAYTIPTTLTSGTYTINATYAGNGTYQLSNGTGNLTVNLIQTQLIVSNVTGTPGSSVNLIGTLTANSNPVSGATINFYVNGSSVGSAPTNSSGVATFAYTIPTTLTSGTYTINATYAGNGTYQLSNGTGNLTVNLIPTSLVVSNVTGTPGSSVNLIGTLTANSNPVSGATINFYVNGSSVGSAPTNSSGVATFAYTIPTTLTSGTYTINATYAGNGTYQLSNGTGNLTVNLIQTQLIVSNVTGTIGTSVNLIGTLTANSNPVSGATINFYVNNNLVGSAVTNTNGVATYAYTIPNTFTSGTYLINATYAGNGTYQNSNGTGNLTANDPPEADVTLSQTGGYSGNTVTFIVTAINNGPDTGTNINITDVIPSGWTATRSSGSYSNGVWTIPSLAYGANATLTITGTSLPESTTINTANLTNQTEYNPYIPYTTSYSVYVPSVDINAEVYPWYYVVATGDELYTYNVGNTPEITVDIWNQGPDDATGVVYNIDIGSGLLFGGSSTTQGTVTYNNSTNSLVWDIGNIPNNGELYLKILVMMIQSGDGTPNLTLNASLAQCNQYDTNPSTDGFDSCSLISTSSAADVAVNQTQTVTNQGNTQYITYTIAASNNGPDNATGVTIKDTLPSGATLTSSNVPAGTTYSGGVWSIPSLADGANITLTLTFKITATTGTIRNTVTKTGETQLDPNMNNNAQTLTYSITGTYTPRVDINAEVYPWYYVVATGDELYTYNVGNTPEITVDIWNQGPDDATGVVYNIDIGSGLLFGGSSTTQGTVTYNNSTNSLVWDIGNIPNNGELYLKILVMMIQSGDGTPNLTLNASLAQCNQYDTNPSTDGFDSCSLISTSSAADVAVNQTQTVTNQGNTQYITYTIAASNNGPDNATGVTIKDTLPSGATLTSSNVPAGTTYSGGVWSIPSLADGANITLTLTFKITATTGTIRNTVTKTGETQLDPNMNNNAQTLTYSIP